MLSEKLVSGPMLERVGARPFPEFEGVHDVWPRGERLRAVRSAATEDKKRFVQQGRVRAVQSVDVAGAPYPYCHGGISSGEISSGLRAGK